MERPCVVTKEFLERYNKSVEEGYDDYSLIDYSGTKPDKNDYEDFQEYINDLCEYIGNKFRYTYGSKAKKKT
jgi:hypothetical protein